MKFGYDRMTRDFRNAAACAIFVVKSDTLFLEQVFAEFQQLLDLFSRIFLVVNVDAHKRDVSPEGKLVPSLEQSQPEAVLKAFEQLAMSAPLQKAAADGKVRMYPVDLLHAASNALQKAPASESPAGFQSFRRDLADFLASSDYLAAFLRDSLQRANTLLGEVLQQTTSDGARDLEKQLDDVDEQLAWLAAEQGRLERALQLDWAAAFARGQRDIDAEVERFARDSGAKLLRTLGASIDTWFLSSHSLDWLVQGQWTPLVRDYRQEVFAAGRRVFDQQQSQAGAGLDLDEGISALCERAGIDLRQQKSAALDGLGGVAWPERTTVAVEVGAIPIRKGVLDLVAFRSVDRVRERLFGPAHKPDVKIPAKDKAARLGDPGRLYLHQCVSQFRGSLLPETVGLMRDFFGQRFCAAAATAVRERLTAHAPRLSAKQRELEATRRKLAAQVVPLRKLAAAAKDLVPRLTALGKAFDQEIAAPKDVVLEPQPPRGREQKPTSPPGKRDRSIEKRR
jgi:hypothetical protein